MGASEAETSQSLLAHPEQPSQRISITINVYDLLPSGRLTDLLWSFGTGLVHSGVVVTGKEYAFGAHQKPGVTGVYWTKPALEPPGATFRCSILHGFSTNSTDEIEDFIDKASRKYQGTSWNLLRNNCNHFTSYLCEQLTGVPAPSFLNRAASIGLALPCFVPEQWIEAPEADKVDGELLDDDSESNEEQYHGSSPWNASHTSDDELDYDDYQMSESGETDDDSRSKWRRKRRQYKASLLANVARSSDSIGKPILVRKRAPDAPP